jgi:hypothetical protein
MLGLECIQLITWAEGCCFRNLSLHISAFGRLIDGGMLAEIDLSSSTDVTGP